MAVDKEAVIADPIRSLVPLAHVRDMHASIAFYAKLGFAVENSVTADDTNQPMWCRLTSGHAELMLAWRERPAGGHRDGVLFYMYCDDSEAAHRLLTDRGLAVGSINRPFYNPGGEFELTDPDGHVIFVAQI